LVRGWYSRVAMGPSWIAGVDSRGGVRVHEDLGDGWFAAYRFVVQSGAPVLGQVHIYSLRPYGTVLGDDPERMASDEPSDVFNFRRASRQTGSEIPAGGLRLRTLRSMHPATSLQRAIADRKGQGILVVDFRDEADELGWEATVRAVQRRLDQPVSTPRTRLERLAQVAQLYAAHVALGAARVNVMIGEAIDRSPSKVRDDIRAARREGLLTEGAGRGRPAGELTDKARRILESADG
jgi:hypothetical protein